MISILTPLMVRGRTSEEGGGCLHFSREGTGGFQDVA